MNLKDAILSTLSELENTQESVEQIQDPESKKPFSIQEKKHLAPEPITPVPLLKNSTRPVEQTHSTIIEERFLEDLRERVLVLFEGLQSPNNINVEAKVDLTLNFLEHLLAQIDTQLDKI